MKHKILIPTLLAILLITVFSVMHAPGQERWRLVSDDTVATVYNAVPEQCDADFVHTACNYEINLNDVESERIVAMERTMMTALGIAYGDVILVEGAGTYDGLWRILDTNNARFEGQHRIDFLVPENIKKGKWTSVKVYVPKDNYRYRRTAYGLVYKKTRERARNTLTSI